MMSSSHGLVGEVLTHMSMVVSGSEQASVMLAIKTSCCLPTSEVQSAMYVYERNCVTDRHMIFLGVENAGCDRAVFSLTLNIHCAAINKCKVLTMSNIPRVAFKCGHPTRRKLFKGPLYQSIHLHLTLPVVDTSFLSCLVLPVSTVSTAVSARVVRPVAGAVRSWAKRRKRST